MAATRSSRTPKTRKNSKKTGSTATLTVANQNKSKKKPNPSARKHASRTRNNGNSDSDRTSDSDRRDSDDAREEEDPRPEGQNSPSDSPSDFVGLTVANFESQLPKWSIYQLRQALHKSKDPPANRIPPEVQDALTLLQQNYIKSKLMLAAIGNVSEETVNKSLGENKPSRRKCAWNRFLAFSLESANTPVPPKGVSIGWEERNQHLGEVWSSLTEDEKDVFSPKVFQYFSKIPCRFGEEEDDDEDEAEPDLTSEEIELYQPLYTKLFNQEKVDMIISKGENVGIAKGTAFKLAERSMQRLNSELFTMSNSYNTTYYLLTATRAPGKNSFCKEWSNDAAWLTLAEKNWRAKEKFEAYSHGREIQESVEDANGVCMKKKRPADTMKIKLRAALNETLGELKHVNIYHLFGPN
ncbi:hypothetical protein PGT21_029930 [Puccinia graminis f. sp. tritici]|uniref:Uncharacterized protein n=1 Tax=Puccinia graminis f. sp. tritici TaxID=56615 RepID=A0A5B0LZX4_PUCGR|nr:hypothetical protein PGT21_029930 [Puccinia graminis f. sp. tritici]